jgi:6-phosphogluconolactonase
MPELIVADDIAEAALAAFLEAAPRLVCLAGGRTPEDFYRRLAGTPLGYPWDEVELVMSDERCVPPDHPDSNERTVREALVGRVQPGSFHTLGGEACDPNRAEERVRSILGGRRLDVAILGLGEDGHTASLFPGDPALQKRDRMVVGVDRPDHRRLTLTLPVLSSARIAVFLVSGRGKRDALARLLAGEDIPAGRVRAARVLAIADQAAAPG